MAGRILIADDVTTNRIVLNVKLSAAFYGVLQAGSGAEAVAVAGRETPDLILLDHDLPDMDAIEACRRLKQNPKTADIPVLIISAASAREARIEALRAGAEDFLPKPVNEALLLARVRNILRTRDTDEELRMRDGMNHEITGCELGFAEPVQSFAPPCDVVLVARDPETTRQWGAALALHGQEGIGGQIKALSRSEALTATESDPAPGIFVLEGGTGSSDDGLYLISELRSRARTRNAGIVVILPEDEPGRESAAAWGAKALDLGANEILTAGFDGEELALRLKRQIARKQQADRLRETLRNGLRLAVTDPLTGLHNRRFAMASLRRIASQARASGRPFALMLLDLDRFKQVNDRHGHSGGDLVLREVAARLRSEIRGADLLARIGGEEFLIVMPDTDISTARKAAERIRRRIIEHPIHLPRSDTPLFVSLSIGVALGGGGKAAPSMEELIEQADRALYAAKSHGRNQVNVSRSAA